MSEAGSEAHSQSVSLLNNRTAVWGWQGFLFVADIPSRKLINKISVPKAMAGALRKAGVGEDMSTDYHFTRFAFDRDEMLAYAIAVCDDFSYVPGIVAIKLRKENEKERESEREGKENESENEEENDEEDEDKDENVVSWVKFLEEEGGMEGGSEIPLLVADGKVIAYWYYPCDNQSALVRAYDNLTGEEKWGVEFDPGEVSDVNRYVCKSFLLFVFCLFCLLLLL